MNTDLSGKRAIVCGSTQGIGKAVAEELAGLGASITLLARSEDKLKAVQAELPTAAGQEHHYVVADFTRPDYLKSAVHAYLEKIAVVHILLNNTGGPPAGKLYEADPDDFRRAFEMHIVCNQLLVQAVLPKMQQAQYGRIINIISTSVKEPIPGLGVSNTTRGAVASWAKTLAAELGPMGITVNNVLPGSTNTDRIWALVKSRAEAQGKSEEEVAGAMKAQVPLRRFAEPSETAAAVAFLASPAAAYITGVSLPVDGGKIGCL
jgi:3-oxoacyl-[acyl-carrier protein] reductase